MKKLLLFLLFAPILSFGAVYNTTGNSTDWFDPLAWDCNCVPAITTWATGDVINIDHELIANSDMDFRNKTVNINSGGSLDVDGTIDFSGHATIFELHSGGYLEADDLNKTNSNTILTLSDSVHIVNNFDITNSANITIAGHIAVDGTMWVRGGSSITTSHDMDVGTLVVSNNTMLRTSGTIRSDALDIQGSGVVTGSGVVGWNTIAMSNNGRIICDGWTQTYYSEPPYNPLDLTSCGEALFVHFINIDAEDYAEGNQTLITWSTAVEQNSEYFIIERSFDGYTFEPIGQVTAAGNSNEILTYSFVDDQQYSNAYYRIKEVGHDGFTYSDVIYHQKQSSVYIDGNQLVVNQYATIQITTIDGRVLYFNRGEIKMIDLDGIDTQLMIIKVVNHSGENFVFKHITQ